MPTSAPKEIKAVCIFCRRKQKVPVEIARMARAKRCDVPCCSNLCVGTLQLLEST